MLLVGSSSEIGTWCGTGDGSDHEMKCERVHRTLKRIVKARGALDAQECAALREAQKLMVWRAFGCASLVEYMTREMGYTERAAVERLRVAKVIEEVPALGEALYQGDLSFSAARELARVVTNETQEAWLEAAQEKNVRQIEEMVSGHKQGDLPTDEPDPALKTKVLRFEVRLSVGELERRARKALARLRGSSVDDSDFMEACFKAVLDQCEAANTNANTAKSTTTSSANASPAHSTEGSTEGSSGGATGGSSGVATGGSSGGSSGGAFGGSAGGAFGGSAGGSTVMPTTPRTTSALVIRDRVLTDAELERLLTPRYQVAVTMCTACKRGWQHGGAGGGSTLLSPPELERSLCDCIDIGDVDGEPAKAKRSIPKALKRHVLHRDGHKCRVPGCDATANIDVHHLEFLMNGGQHTLANCLALCEGHHLALHEGSLLIEGDAYNAAFTFRPQNKLKIASRAVECAAALRARGIAKELIKGAVEATRAHVGQRDLTTRQWVDIALTKLPGAIAPPRGSAL